MTRRAGVLIPLFSIASSRSWGMGEIAAFRAYVDEQSWWLDEYALFRALHVRYGERAWFDWPEPVRSRQADALAAARMELADEMLFRQYVQWIAGDQWGRARDAAGHVA